MSSVRALDYLLKALVLVREYCADMFLFVRYNNHSPVWGKAKRSYYQTAILSHAIEKGLSLPEPRAMFGRDKIRSLLNHLQSFDRSFSRFPVSMGEGAVQEYRDFNLTCGFQDDPTLASIDEHLQSVDREPKGEGTGGVRNIEVGGRIDANEFDAFSRSRVSCRTFDPAPLSTDEVRDVIKIAQAAPSQCNRQSVRVHFYQNTRKISKLLSLQGGASGFESTVGNLFIVTSEIAAWGGPQQRNQPYVDGGLFAMMLMLGLHAKGIASCPLNLAVLNSVEREIRSVGEIPAGERLIMMLAAGNPSGPTIKVAKSPRCEIDGISSFH